MGRPGFRGPRTQRHERRATRNAESIRSSPIRDQLVLQAWCQENGLHIKAVHWTWRWEGGPFHQDWTGHSPLARDWRGNIYNFVRGNKTPLQPGMCFSDEPMIAIYGEFGIRLEDCLYITESGAKFFTQPSPAIDRPFA
jgi:hypothetical protein